MNEEIYDDYNIEDGNDPLKEFLDKDLSTMGEAELSALLSSLNEASENPKAVKRILTTERKKKDTAKAAKATAEALLASLGL